MMSMMPWNHRVMRHDDEDGEWFAIHEVYYDKEKPVGWTHNHISPSGDNIDDLRITLQRMLAALDKPILEYGKESLPEGEA